MRRLLNGFYAQLLLVTVLPLTLILSAVAFGALAMHQESMRSLVAERDMRAVMTTAKMLSDLLTRCAEEASAGASATPAISSAVAQACVTPSVLNALINPMPEHRRADAYVFDRAGNVVAHTDPQRVGMKVDAHAGVTEALRGSHGTQYQDDPITHVEHVVSFAALQLPEGNEPLGLIIEEPWEDVIDPMMRISLAAPLVLFPVTLLAAMAITLGLRRIVRPLQRLGARAQSVESGDFDALTLAPAREAIQEIHDLSEMLEKMARRIQADQQTLRIHAQAVLRAQETERTRLAHELHDGTIQNLVALTQRIQLLKAELPVASTPPGRLNGLLAQVQNMIEDVRRISRGLRPIYLEELGLMSALERLACEADELSAQRTPPLRVAFECSGDIPRLGADVELALFRIAQEALNNALRHADARHVNIDLSALPGALSLTVTDDGHGFDVSRMHNPDGLGLFGMRERASSVGAQLEIASTPGRGACINVKVPF